MQYSRNIDMSHVDALSTKIIQREFHPHEKAELRSLVSPEDLDVVDAYPNHYHVYFRENERIQTIFLFSAHQPFTDRLPDLTFCEYLRMLPVINYNTIIFALGTYGVTNRALAKHMISYPFKKYEGYLAIIEDLLAPTFGFLMFTHQLEQLYSIATGESCLAATNFRRAFNKKVPTARKCVESLYIDGSTSINDILIERSDNEDHFVYSPQYKNAFLVYRLLSENK